MRLPKVRKVESRPGKESIARNATVIVSMEACERLGGPQGEIVGSWYVRAVPPHTRMDKKVIVPQAVRGDWAAPEAERIDESVVKQPAHSPTRRTAASLSGRVA